MQKLVSLLFTLALLTGNAFAGSFSATNFQHPNFSNANSNFQTPEFSITKTEFQHTQFSQSSIENFQRPDFSSFGASVTQNQTADRIQTVNSQFESVAGNSGARFREENSQFSNMRMEFHDSEMQHLNFNVK